MMPVELLGTLIRAIDSEKLECPVELAPLLPMARQLLPELERRSLLRQLRNKIDRRAELREQFALALVRTVGVQSSVAVASALVDALDQVEQLERGRLEDADERTRDTEPHPPAVEQ